MLNWPANCIIVNTMNITGATSTITVTKLYVLQVNLTT